MNYKTKSGDIGSCPIACITRVSDGECFADYKIRKVENEDIEILIQNLKYGSRANGFRFKMISTRRFYIFRFFGDSQDEVNSFIDAISSISAFKLSRY